MAVRKILLLGNPRLYQISKEVKHKEIDFIRTVVEDLHDTLIDFRNKYGVGRAIAAPQIGVMKRIIYMYIDKPFVFINPTLTFTTNQMMEVWDDCMCFPNLLVKVKRYKKCRIEYIDINWNRKYMDLEGDLSELLQHEYDHLDGILAVARAINDKSFAFRSELQMK